MSRDLYNAKRKAKSIAKDFKYPASVLDAISKANSENEISRIMHDARLATEV